MHSAGLFYGDLYLVDMVISLRGNIFYSVYTSLCVLIAKMLIQHIYLYIFIYISSTVAILYHVLWGSSVSITSGYSNLEMQWRVFLSTSALCGFLIFLIQPLAFDMVIWILCSFLLKYPTRSHLCFCVTHRPITEQLQSQT